MVTARVAFRGTLRGEFQGIPPTGKEVAFTSIEVTNSCFSEVGDALSNQRPLPCEGSEAISYASKGLGESVISKLNSKGSGEPFFCCFHLVSRGVAARLLHSFTRRLAATLRRVPGRIPWRG